MSETLTVDVAELFYAAARDDAFRKKAMELWPNLEWPDWNGHVSYKRDCGVVELEAGTYRIFSDRGFSMERYF